MLAIPSPVPPRTLSLVVRRRRRAARRRPLPVDHVRRGIGWVLSWLRRRTKDSAAAVGRKIQLGPQTVRDIENGTCGDFGWCNACKICQCLHYDLSTVEDLTQRYLIFDQLHQRRLHKDEPNWKYTLPWSMDRAKEDEKRYIRQNRARYTVFASTAGKSMTCAHEHGVILQS
jgi:hypothetical protein